MKNILTSLVLTICALCATACEDDKKEKCDCEECPCAQVRDMEPQAGGMEEMMDADMGLEEEPQEDPEEEQAGGVEEEDMPVGGQDASEEDCGEMPEDEEMCVPEMMPEEEPEDDDVVDCECESSEDCEC